MTARPYHAGPNAPRLNTTAIGETVAIAIETLIHVHRGLVALWAADDARRYPCYRRVLWYCM